MTVYSGFSHKKIVIFHSYVKLPEGNGQLTVSIYMSPTKQPYTSHIMAPCQPQPSLAMGRVSPLGESPMFDDEINRNQHFGCLTTILNDVTSHIISLYTC